MNVSIPAIKVKGDIILIVPVLTGMNSCWHLGLKKFIKDIPILSATNPDSKRPNIEAELAIDNR